MFRIWGTEWPILLGLQESFGPSVCLTVSASASDFMSTQAATTHFLSRWAKQIQADCSPPKWSAQNAPHLFWGPGLDLAGELPGGRHDQPMPSGDSNGYLASLFELAPLLLRFLKGNQKETRNPVWGILYKDTVSKTEIGLSPRLANQGFLSPGFVLNGAACVPYKRVTPKIGRS